MTVLAYNLRWWCAQRGVSLNQVALDMGVSVELLCQLARGEPVDQSWLGPVADYIGLERDVANDMMFEPADALWERRVEALRPPAPTTPWPLDASASNLCSFEGTDAARRD